MTFAVSAGNKSLKARLSATTTDQPDNFLPDRYQTVSLVGRGSFSEIWQIREISSGQLFALKRLRSDRRSEPVTRRLFEIEAKVAKECNSPYVVDVVAANFDGDQPYLILKWLEGQTLQQMLSESGRLSLRRSLWIARQSALGLDDLQQAGYTHGDIKPANIVLNPSGAVQLIDLGFARSTRSKNDDARSNLMTGTAEYLAPEVLSRGSFSPIARDMYSLGVTLFQMLTGRLPFESDSVVEMLKLQRQAKPPMLRRWCPEAPRELAELVNRLLAKQPIRRPTTYKSLIRELISLELPTMLANAG